MALPLTTWTFVVILCSLRLFEATGLAPLGSLAGSPGPPLQSLDLLAAMGLSNVSWPGVSMAPGYLKGKPAYLLEGIRHDLRLPPDAFQEAATLLRHGSEFTIGTWLRQEVENTGTIFSVSNGPLRFLEVQSSGRRNEIRLHYTSLQDRRIYMETFHYRLADNMWHHLAVTVSGSQVEVLVDCHPLYKRVLRPGQPDRNVSDHYQIWLGQRHKHYFFKGFLQDLRLIEGSHGVLAVCPQLDVTCPTCGQFLVVQNAVQSLERKLIELSQKLANAEMRLTMVEDCDCQKSCRLNDTIHADGSTWQRNCDICSCKEGEIKCHPVKCAIPDCKHPVRLEGQCCETCLKECFFNGKMYDHGDVVTIEKCKDCTCIDGSMDCKVLDPKDCPILSCPVEQQLSVSGSCCKICQDIDECQQEGGREGHHCHSNTICVNTQGSYECRCLDGYVRVDRFNCAELDECSTGHHNCDLNADCVNTEGSYKCQCREGYDGDGYHCTPICRPACLNGGVCVKPGQCSCPGGYTGSACERDLDECTTNAHRCTNSSICVNMIGWYYCQCKPGYEGPTSDNNLGTSCIDIDECEESKHTCHSTAQCVNTDGGFECACPAGSIDCRYSCIFEEREIAHGITVQSKTDPCHSCTCNKGVVKCEKPKCDCKKSSTDSCCPQCDSRYTCKHQELNDVIFMHGERWSYQCQTCECFYGELDCFEMKCPPLICSNPIQSPGDCCPHCGDLCSIGGNYSLGLGRNCTFKGVLYQSGSDFLDPQDPCTTCKCKDGELCCNFNYHCGNSPPQPMGYDGLVVSNRDSRRTTIPASSPSGAQSARPMSSITSNGRSAERLRQPNSATGGGSTVSGKKRRQNAKTLPPGD